MKINTKFIAKTLIGFCAWWVVGILMAIVMGTIVYIQPPEWIKLFYVIEGFFIGTVGGLFWMIVNP